MKNLCKPFAFDISDAGCATDNAQLEIFPCTELVDRFTPIDNNPLFSTCGMDMFLQRFDRCALPFGVLVAATEAIDDQNLLASARIVAEFLDQDRDGKIIKLHFNSNLICIVLITCRSSGFN